MYSVQDAFKQYLITKKGVSYNTLIAYTKDSADFLFFLYAQDITLDTVTISDFSHFLRSLENKRLSSATARRKQTALRSFCLFLNKELKMPDYREGLLLRTSFPLLCDEQFVHNKVKELTKYHSLPSLQKAVILSLLLTGKITSIQLLKLRKESITTPVLSVGPQKIVLSHDTFMLIRNYCSLLPDTCIHLFPLISGSMRKPLSRAGLWSILKSLIPYKRLVVSHVHKSSHHPIPTHLKNAYKRNHPRS